MPKKDLTPQEKKTIVEGHASSGLKVPDYCKQKKISMSQFYSWQRALRSGDKVKPRKKIRTVQENKYENALRVQNQVLKEMLADAYHDLAEIKKAA